MPQNKKNRQGRGFDLYAVCLILLFVGSMCFYSGRWYVGTYGNLGFDSILYTLTNSLAGVQSGLIISYCRYALLSVLTVVAAAAVLLFPYQKKALVLWIAGKVKMSLLPVRRSVALAVCIALSGYFILTAAVETQFLEMVRNGSKYSEPSQLYETYFVDPAGTEITFPEEKRNLIYIYLESMETAFMDQENGGALEYNTIPELTRLAQENINFSHRDGVGGFFAPSGTTWTIAAMVAQNAGIPLKTPAGVDDNSYGTDGSFLPGVRTSMDILKDNGYTQVLMVGSDAEFCGREPFYNYHGVDRIQDYYTAMEEGIIPQDYYVWWGMDDHYLYEYAKQSITDLAAQEEPFAFTMLTVDTHHIDGWVCQYCESQYGEQYENVFRCASKQLDSFLTWLQQQEFYENTTVVIAGDHPSMDGAYFTRRVSSDYERYVYNCFINSAAEPAGSVTGRQFSTVDMFPTTLAALGCQIEGDRLGLGVNLFSDQPTLMEIMGKENFDFEMSRYSQYYMDNFFAN